MPYPRPVLWPLVSAYECPRCYGFFFFLLKFVCPKIVNGFFYRKLTFEFQYYVARERWSIDRWQNVVVSTTQRNVFLKTAERLGIQYYMERRQRDWMTDQRVRLNRINSLCVLTTIYRVHFLIDSSLSFWYTIGDCPWRS